MRLRRNGINARNSHRVVQKHDPVPSRRNRKGPKYPQRAQVVLRVSNHFHLDGLLIDDCRSKFTISQLQTKINLEGGHSKYDPRCRKCCLKLRQSGASYAVAPETKKSKFPQKLLKKAKRKQPLTKFQAKYLKKNDLTPGNRLVWSYKL
mgnify:FL=1